MIRRGELKAFKLGEKLLRVQADEVRRIEQQLPRWSRWGGTFPPVLRNAGGPTQTRHYVMAGLTQT